MRLNGSIDGNFSDGAAFANGVAVSEKVQLPCFARWRVRWKSTCAGTLSAAYVRVDNTAYGSNLPSNVPVSANTETVMEENEHFGEATLLLTFTPSADGTLNYADISRV